MNRKNFLKTTAVTGLGVSLGLPAFSNKEIISDKIFLDLRKDAIFWSLLKRFAFAVGTNVVSSLVTDYIKKIWFDPDLKAGIKSANRMMAIPDNGGFTDLSRSEVFNNGNRKKGVVMYQASTPNGDNVCVPVFDLNREKRRPTAMLEGPVIAALGQVAEQNFSSKKKAGEYLLPIKEISQGQGGFDTGLKKPTIYVSKGGIVSVDYKNLTNGIGVARVGLTDGRSEILLDREIEIRYA